MDDDSIFLNDNWWEDDSLWDEDSGDNGGDQEGAYGGSYSDYESGAYDSPTFSEDPNFYQSEQQLIDWVSDLDVSDNEKFQILKALKEAGGFETNEFAGIDEKSFGDEGAPQTPTSSSWATQVKIAKNAPSSSLADKLNFAKKMAVGSRGTDGKMTGGLASLLALLNNIRQTAKKAPGPAANPGHGAATPMQWGGGGILQSPSGPGGNVVGMYNNAIGPSGMRPTMPPAGTGRPMARGGLVMMARGGQAGGQSDVVPAMLSPGEYVVDADVVSSIGDGSTDAGAAKLDKMRQAVRAKKRSAPVSKIPPKLQRGPLMMIAKGAR